MIFFLREFRCRPLPTYVSVVADSIIFSKDGSRNSQGDANSQDGNTNLLIPKFFAENYMTMKEFRPRDRP